MRAALSPFQSQARLWLAAFVASALLNALVLLMAAWWMVERIVLRPPPVAAPLETVAMIVPMAAAKSVPETVPDPVEEVAAGSRFARTSPDQVEEAPEKADFIGERNTRATSDAPAVVGAPDQPSQRGREPEFEDEVETTESDYQDGELASERVADASATAARPPGAEAASTEAAADQRPADAMPEREQERLAEGPLPVDRMVEERKAVDEAPKPSPTDRRSEGESQSEAEKALQSAAVGNGEAAAEASSPGFRGNQKKTRLEGSIARSGRSALNVEDSVLGRYHAAVSRAVEKEWQRNCVRNRDYITPGLLTMSFLLDASGKVRGVSVVEDVEVGAIPKGFTLKSIQGAEIPGMPADLKKQLDGEPLEFIYRFNF